MSEENTEAIIISSLARIEGNLATLQRDFSEFKETCHSRQSLCRREVHGRINMLREKQVSLQERQAKMNGMHERAGDKEPTTHRRKPLNWIKSYWPYLGLAALVGALFLMGIGAALGEHIIFPLIQKAVKMALAQTGGA